MNASVNDNVAGEETEPSRLTEFITTWKADLRRVSDVAGLTVPIDDAVKQEQQRRD